MPKKSKDTKKPSPAETDWARVDAMSDAELREAARSDPDAQPVSAEWFARAAQRRAARKAAAE
jgi:hypothetical protein